MLFSGCCSVSEHPAVCTCVFMYHDFSDLAPYRSFIIRAQIRRAARSLHTSSKNSLCELKKKDSRGANVSTGIPRSRHASTYSIPSRSVNASSWVAVDPASRMWYPEIDTECHLGMNFDWNSIVSTTSLTEGSGG